MNDVFEKGRSVLKQTMKSAGAHAGVYQMYNAEGEILYVGKAKVLKNRLASYTRVESLPRRQQRMIRELDHIVYVITHSEVEALLLESNLIKKHRPPYNILLKDDKSFPYIVLSGDHLFPRIAKYRGPKTGRGKFFGPFANVAAVDEAIVSVQRVFQIRNCTDTYFKNRTRPCLQYDIKRCSAPCTQKISQQEYQRSVAMAAQFLQGKTDDVQQILAQKMEQCAEAMDFEQAAVYRDRIRLLTQIQARQRINTMEIDNADVIALYSDGHHTAVQIFFFRHHRNYGNEARFLSHVQGCGEDEQMSAFLMQFYAEREPPAKVLLSHEPADFDTLRQTLKEIHGVSVQWEVPKKGTKADLVGHAMANAKQSLERRTEQEADMNDIFARLRETFGLPEEPERIEVYDNSHLSGTGAYGVMIVVTKEGFERKSYRKFMIRRGAGQEGKGVREEGGRIGESSAPPSAVVNADDIAMMQEVMVRRFSHTDDWGVPSLLLIDGGLAQVNAVQSVLDSCGLEIPVIGISKGPDRNAGRERFWRPRQSEPLHVEYDSRLMYFLQRIRDEAHRFAIGTQRASRQKNIRTSVLDQIPGIGASRKKLLLHHFGSAKAVGMASLEDLERVSGINRATAAKIYAFFHES